MVSGEVPSLELGDPVGGHVQPVQLQQGVEEGPFYLSNLENQPIENRQYWKTSLKAHLVITQVKQFQPSSKFIRLQQRRIGFSGIVFHEKKPWV